MTNSLPALDRYMRALADRGAPVLGRLVAGASNEDIESVAALDGVTSTNELHAYFSTINGVVDGEPYGHLIFFHHLYEPRSTADAIDHYEFLGEMRAGPHLETQRESDEWWPKGMVRFGGFDSDGLYVNCIDGSPTFGAVYEVHANTSPFMRIANSMRAYFETLTAAIETGAIELIETPGEHEDKGELVTIYPKYEALARRMNPDCPKYQPDAERFWKPDWL